jgi:hypothetical protein
MASKEELAIAQAIADSSLIGYAQEYVKVDGKPFSFEDHAYLIDMYADIHPYQVVEKSAQMGASVLGMIKSLYVCDKLGKNVLYYFPTDEDVREFSKSRVAPIIKDSPYISGLVGSKDVDSVGLRQIGRGFLYFRGMRSNIRLKSVPGDMLVFDELDEVTPDQKELAEKRLLHSSLKWKYMLSTPTFDGYGIDYEFGLSDKRYWNLVCKKCETHNICEFQFPDIIKRISETKAILVCRKCDSELDKCYGFWKPEKKTERVRGYHLCGLYGGVADLSEMLYKYESGRGREEFMRSDLGIPWISSDMRVTADMVESCMDQGTDMAMIQGERSYMGVDQRGSELHIVIRQNDKITGRPRVLFVGKVATFFELDRYMREYDVNICVIDGLPNQHSARDFAKRFGGRVYLCYYVDTQKGSYKWIRPGENTQDEFKDWAVNVNRTESLDAMYEEITRRDLILPRMPDDTRKEFIEQVVAMAKVIDTDEDTGLQKAIWKKLGADHYAHANSYSAIAMSQFKGGGPKAITIGSSFQTRVANYRRFDRV